MKWEKKQKLRWSISINFRFHTSYNTVTGKETRKERRVLQTDMERYKKGEIKVRKINVAKEFLFETSSEKICFVLL